MKAILWFSWHPTPYNDFLFQALAKEFDLTVIYVKRKLSTHPWGSADLAGFNSLFLSSWRDWPRIIRTVMGSRHILRVIAGWDHPLFLGSLFWYSLTGSDYLIWTDTPNKSYQRRGLKRWFNQYVITRFVNNADCILVTGEIGVKTFRDLYPHAKRIVNFPFATNTEVFQPDPDRTWSDTPVFISVGRLLNSHKGFDLAVAAVASVVNRQPNLKFSYFIIGDGPDRGQLESLIDEFQLRQQVKIVNWLESSDTLKYYQKCRFLVHPSHFDPFPNTVLEAMACGAPVIGSSAAGSVLERIVHNENGLIFAEGDVAELSTLIETLLLNPDQCERLGRNARATAEKWSVSYHTAQMKQLTKG